MAVTQDELTEKILAGRRSPIEERQARWDRVQEWAWTKSLSEMVVLEAGISGTTLSRERIRAIKDGARPGSVGRPKLPGLLAQQRRARERLALWKKKPKTKYQAMRIAEVRAELEEATAAVKAEQKRLHY